MATEVQKHLGEDAVAGVKWNRRLNGEWKVDFSPAFTPVAEVLLPTEWQAFENVPRLIISRFLDWQMWKTLVRFCFVGFATIRFFVETSAWISDLSDWLLYSTGGVTLETVMEDSETIEAPHDTPPPVQIVGIRTTTTTNSPISIDGWVRVLNNRSVDVRAFEEVGCAP